MIKYEERENEIIIKGKNKTDFAIIGWILFVFGLIVLSLKFKLEDGIFEEIIYIIGIILILFSFKGSIRFKIVLTKNCLKIKKSFLAIPYLNIEWNFDKVQKINPLIVQFKNGNQKLEIENFEGFEIDCLLIIKGKSRYEIGDKEDAQNIFNYLLNGIETLKIKGF
ncbi:MAG: hypothetical protein WBA17_03655 [Saprospiraceae bacterium]